GGSGSNDSRSGHREKGNERTGRESSFHDSPPQLESAEEPRFPAGAFGTTTSNIMNGYSGFSGIPVNFQRKGRTAVCASGASSRAPAGASKFHRAPSPGRPLSAFSTRKSVRFTIMF